MTAFISSSVSVSYTHLNGLVVLEEVCPLSARMIVNPVSMRMENERINELITNLRNLLQEEKNAN